jgi:ribosomal protection tetracycline resistance protein
VVSAVEGVQPQTVVLWRVLRRLAVPTAIFINKIDRRGAAPARAHAEIGRRLAAGSGERLLPLTDVLAAGSPGATTTPVPLTDPTVIDVLTTGDDRLLNAALDGPCVTEAMALRSARTQVAHGTLVPIAAGSALTGAGVPDLLTTLPRLMPWARQATRSPSGVIYKIEHGDHGTLAHCRMFGGELRARDRVGAADARPEVITSLERSTPHGWAGSGQPDVVAGLLAYLFSERAQVPMVRAWRSVCRRGRCRAAGTDVLRAMVVTPRPP